MSSDGEQHGASPLAARITSPSVGGGGWGSPSKMDNRHVAVGMWILANYNGAGRYHPGEITWISAEGNCTVVYEDGDGTWTEQNVEPERIRAMPGTPLSMPVSSLRMGSACEVNLKGLGRWYRGSVKSIHRANGEPTTFDARLEDGDGAFEANAISFAHIRSVHIETTSAKTKESAGVRAAAAARHKAKFSGLAPAARTSASSKRRGSSSSSSSSATAAAATSTTGMKRWNMRPALQLRNGMTVEVHARCVEGGPPSRGAFDQWRRGKIVAIVPECIGYGICRPRTTTVECARGGMASGVKDGDIRLVPAECSLIEGDVVVASYRASGEWRRGVVVGIHTGITYDVAFEDADGEGSETGDEGGEGDAAALSLDGSVDDGALLQARAKRSATEHNVRRDLLRVSVADARPAKVRSDQPVSFRRPSHVEAWQRAAAAEASLATLRTELAQAQEECAALRLSELERADMVDLAHDEAREARAQTCVARNGLTTLRKEARASRAASERAAEQLRKESAALRRQLDALTGANATFAQGAAAAVAAAESSNRARASPSRTPRSPSAPSSAERQSSSPSPISSSVASLASLSASSSVVRTGGGKGSLSPIRRLSKSPGQIGELRLLRSSRALGDE